MKPPARLLLLVMAAAGLMCACGRHRQRVLEVDYVSAPQVILRDQLAQVYNKVGAAKNGDRVEVVEREKRFAKIRLANGVEGWVEQRYLVNEEVYKSFQKLAKDAKDAPVAGTAVTRNDTNLHVEPGRDTEHLYQVAQGAKLSVMKREAVERVLPGGVKPAVAKDANPPMEDWWLVRDAQDHVGWVLARLIDIDVPLEVAQYAEGQRIIACFVLDQVKDGDKQVPQFLMLLSEPKDGLPFDYNQARVFTWNLKRHRYETAYRERLNGILPVTISHEDFGKEGDLPTFTLRGKDSKNPDGPLTERRYKMNTPIVRRVG